MVTSSTTNGMRHLLTTLLYALFMFAHYGTGQADDKKAPLDITETYKNPLSHGFGDDIMWVKWEEAIETALDENKPIFLLIHKTWCGACRSLKKTLQQSTAKKAFKRLSEYFVMVNTADDEEPFEEEYRPDGPYIPRVLFLDKNGDVLLEFKNKKAQYKTYGYYYSSPADILNSMKDVLDYFGIEVPKERKGEPLKPKPKKAPPPIKISTSSPQGPESTIQKKAEDKENTTVDRVGQGGGDAKQQKEGEKDGAEEDIEGEKEKESDSQTGKKPKKEEL